MAQNDWALSVGIRVYPDLGDLDGPENDATAFHEWVTSPGGGAVPADHARLVLSSQFHPPFASAAAAGPTADPIRAFFEQLEDVANASNARGDGLVAGRRLYLYFCGHGFAPTEAETALLMANATRSRVGHHIPGRSYADWFYKAGCFEQVLLFMDCCRETYPKVPVNNFIFTEKFAPGWQEREGTFYAFATKWSRLSREKALGDGKVRGIFTATLLAGLKGGAADQKNGGGVTTASLKSYLYNNMRSLLSEADLNNPDIPTEPDVEAPRNPTKDFVIVGKAAGPGAPTVPRFPIRIKVAEALRGKKASVLEGGLTVVAAVDAVPIPWEIDLPRGLYKVDVGADDASFLFEVKGLGAQNVPS
jgi:hypothetical protein